MYRDEYLQSRAQKKYLDSKYKCVSYVLTLERQKRPRTDSLGTKDI